MRISALVLNAVLGAVLLLAAALAVTPRFLLESRAYVVLFCATFLLTLAYVGRRLVRRRPPFALAVALLPVAALLAIVDLLAVTHLETPFWEVASPAAFCADVGHGTPLCRAPGTLAAAAAPDMAAPGVWLVGHGWHTGLVLETAAIDLADWPFAAEVKRQRFVEVGWGDAEFFQAAEPGLVLAADAMATPGPSVIHVATFDPDVATRFRGQEILRLPVSREGLAALHRFVAASFVTGEDGLPVTSSPGDYGEGSRFVEARGLYSFPRTCNVWTAEALTAAGLPLTPKLAITARNLLFQAGRAGWPVR